MENRIRLYRSTEEYTDDLSTNTMRYDVKLENLFRAFAGFFLVLAWISVGFVISRSLPKVKWILKILHLRFIFFVIERLLVIKMNFSRMGR